jgi:transcriptional regulator with GAF, ATPase, and Fis domain/tetratricopeptide (TPR) repeat protein
MANLVVDSIPSRYRVTDRLAMRGETEAYAGIDSDSGAEVVIKISLADEGMALGEYQFLRRLEHPALEHVVDVGRTPVGGSFLVAVRAKGTPLSLGRVANPAIWKRLAWDLCNALAYLHARGIVHGDVNPSNVIVTEEGHATLIDLGLAKRMRDVCDGDTDVATDRGFSGTPGYAAPEALLGVQSERADLFGLGATLFFAWAGHGPFGEGRDAVVRMLRAPAPSIGKVAAPLPSGWNELLAELLASESAKRPVGAREVLARMARLAPDADDDTALRGALAVPHPAGDPLAGMVVGRTAAEKTLVALLGTLLSPETRVVTPVAVVCGDPGSGRRTLLRRVMDEVRIAGFTGSVPTLEWIVDRKPDWDQPDLLADRPDTEPRAAAARRRWLTELETARDRTGRAICVVFLETPVAEQRACMALCNTIRPAGIVVLGSDTDPSLLQDSLSLSLQPLSGDDIALLARQATGVAPSVEWIAGCLQATGGLAEAVALLVRDWILSSNRPSTFTAGAVGSDLDAVLRRNFGLLAVAEQRRVLLAALCPQGVDALGADVTSVSGWLVADGRNRCRVLSQRHAQAAIDGGSGVALDAPLRNALSTLVSSLDDKDGDMDPERLRLQAECCVLLQQTDRASVMLFRAGTLACRLGRFELSVRTFARGETLGVPLSIDHAPFFVRALGMQGQYAEARSRIASLQTRASGLEVARLSAWVERRSGDLESACNTLEHVAHGDDARIVAGDLARMRVSQGRYEDALSWVRFAADTDPSAKEAEVLALAYLGRTVDASRVAAAIQTTETFDRGKALALQALVAQLAGANETAAQTYRAAVAAYQASGDPHGAATATLNLALTLADSGDLASALPSFDRAIVELGRLGALRDKHQAVFNAGLLFARLGDTDSALSAEQVLAKMGHRNGVAAWLPMLASARLRTQGRFAAAAEKGEQAADAFESSGDPAMAATCCASAAIDWLHSRSKAPAGRLLSRISDSLQSLDEVLLAKIAFAMASRSSPTSEAENGALLALANRLINSADAATLSGRRIVALRLAVAAARALETLGDERAGRWIRNAQSRLQEIRNMTPDKWKDGLLTDPDIGWLSHMGNDEKRNTNEGTQASVADLATRVTRAESRLRRFVRISRRINTETGGTRLLETILDTVLELTEGERGFILLRGAQGELTVKLARNISEETLHGESLAFSRSIASQVAQTGEPVVTVDAAGDARFAKAMSVSHLRLRSVIAVPLIVRGETLGTIYVDNRLRRGAFTDEDLQVLLDFAEQAAIAIENTRLVSELRRSERQVAALNEQLQSELQVRKEEISSMRVELHENREALALRYDYRNIVGRSPAMQDLFRLLDRVTDTDLPVVVLGESGTGKELVARAIAANGARKAKPFVSENCAAIAETLLESTLFGYVKGAFTGADRDTRGLLAVADGGTLFLDEVAEMSPALQGKLLRVLQDGEYRRVGGQRVEKANVRVIAATNRDLEKMVAEGKFRQDLYYRLAVVTIRLPPLRDRREDIPLLVERFLKAHERNGICKTIAPAALSRLCAHRWPGNVRELENEIGRAFAFSESSITVADLSPHLASDDGAGVPGDPDDLSLKPRVERLEKFLIREALGRFDGNQTKAARILGLSRFGLQKKLVRYNLPT